MALVFSGVTFDGGFEIQPTFPPNAPTVGTATATGATTATVTFTAPSYGGSTTITTYTATSSPGNITGTLSQAGSGTITISGLSSSTSYTFTVTATNSVGTSVASAASNSITTESSGTPPVNTVAPVVSGTATYDYVLSCTTGTWTGTATITYAYQWQRSSGTYSNILGANNSTYTLVADDVNKTIRCVVTGTNSTGSSSANSNATGDVSPVAPTSPTSVTASVAGATSASVSFTAPSNNGGWPISSYTATSSPGGITGTINQSGSGTIAVTGLTTGTAYTFTVTATNGYYTSSPSSASNSVTPAIVNRLYTWGYNGGFKLGLGDTNPRSNPTQVGVATNWGSLTTIDGYTNSYGFGIQTDGSLWSWGNNNFGQLGLSTSTAVNKSSPTQIGTDTNWASIFGDGNAVTAIKTNGTIWSWGQNFGGVLGQNNSVYRSSPVQIGSLTTWSKVSMLDQSVFAIKTNGSLWTWGYNNVGQLGQGNTISRSSPVQVGVSTNWSNVGPGGAIG